MRSLSSVALASSSDRRSPSPRLARWGRTAFALATIAGFVACSSSDDAPGDAANDGGTTTPNDGIGEAGQTDATEQRDSAKDGPNGNDGGTDASLDAHLDADAEADAPLSYKHYDINHVLSTGQSDSVANGASPPLTSTQPFTNVMFDVGVMTGRDSPTLGCDGEGCKDYDTPTTFVPLKEGDRFLRISGQPMGFPVETMSSGLANQASVFAKEWFTKVGLQHPSHDILVSLHGRSGNTYWCLRRDINPGASFCYLPGTYISPFEEGLMQVASAKQIAADMGKTYVVRAVTAIHGGSDHYDDEEELSNLDRNDGMGKVGNYTGALLEWQRDYEAQVKAITGQTEAVPLFVSQFGSFTNTPTSRIPVRQLAAHVQAPGKVVVVTPNYPFVHYTDCNHYTNYSQRRLGAYFAKAYQKVVVEGGTFEPLRPIAINRAGNVVTIKFVVPVPPMVIDTTRVTNPGNLGFTYADSTSSATITNVALAGPDTVTVTLSNAPTGATPKLRYALNAPVPNACPGPTQGARGNLRDSDGTQGYHRDGANNPYELHNWAVHFELDVP